MASKADIATEFLSLCASGKVREAYDRHVAENFRHHNAYFPGDRDALLTAMEQSAQSEPNKSFTVRQTIESADRVAVMSHLRRAQVDLEYAVVHILRFEQGRIVEMWDVAQEIPRDSPNQLGMF
ncbi:polyketide cyclase [Rhodanobacter sp. Root627]|jgi:predicted SnoaL-like aldol condensation-catalyzing enzyme|uniref:nuclear transport factor 2 family protein n=1 Tax=Rhodanobacter sp. Root627 TaxID=1736572 RepID=UPI0006F4C7FE|nr:nuclear transport factor 2 family protein [Rhodanobacter sp. Root627]KRA33764.1 polyketide cyclase [Rhodanobacter sp. Root627]